MQLSVLHASFLGIIIFVTIITIILRLAINSQSKNLVWNLPGNWHLVIQNTSPQGRKTAVCFPLRRHLSASTTPPEFFPVSVLKGTGECLLQDEEQSKERHQESKEKEEWTRKGHHVVELSGGWEQSFLWWRISEIRIVCQSTSQPAMPPQHPFSYTFILQNIYWIPTMCQYVPCAGEIHKQISILDACWWYNENDT